MYGQGAIVHVGICTQFFRRMELSRIQKAWTACKDLEGFVNNEED